MTSIDGRSQLKLLEHASGACQRGTLGVSYLLDCHLLIRCALRQIFNAIKMPPAVMVGCRSAASEASLVVLEIPIVLTAVIHLAGAGRPEAVHAAVMSPAEVAAGRSPWAGSQHQVFR